MSAGKTEPERSMPASSSLPSVGPQATDIDGLLDGLGAADFDDFDGLEESLGAPVKRERSPTPEHDDPHYEPPAPAPAEVPSFVSFATAAGKKLSAPSDAAMSRALKIVREAERDAQLEDAPNKRRRTESPVPSGSASTPAPAKQTRPLPAHLPPPPESPLVARSGFQSAAGRAVPPPSGAARARALALLGEDDAPATGFQLGSGGAVQDIPSDARARALAMFGEDAAGPATPATPTSGFMLGSGKAAPPPKPESMARALALFDDDASASSEPTPGPSGFQLGSGKAAPAPSAESMARAMALLDEEAGPSTPRLRSRGGSAAPETPASPAFTAPRPARLSAVQNAPQRLSTPSRTPLAATTNTFESGISTPVLKLSKRLEIRTPGSTPRRIGLGAGGSGRGRAKKGFVTPFKRGPAAGAAVTTPSTLRTPAPRPSEPAKIYKSVFDLQPPPDRKDMRSSFVYPGYYTLGELQGMGLPDEIWTLDLSNALYYQFIGEDARTLGTEQALERLKADGCELATQKWVDNHWRLILWKVAGQVMAKPALFDDKWNWFEVICQLKYRYEREFGAAQRPVVRRIQEHDSSPSLPMILCIAGIHRPEPVLDEKNEPVAQRPYVDLTDGWYIIRALMDDCLARGLAKGKIRVGRKLAIAGAKLESGSDGAEVLDAYDKSHLVLSGNSTHLARWDARLGVQGQPFIAGLSSLSVDGGPIVLMDVILERVYPLAFMSGDRGSREPPWGEDEETTRAEAWKDKYEAESRRLGEEMRRRLEKVEDLASILASHAEDVGAIPPGSPPDVDGDFDELLETRDVMARLRATSSAKIVHLANYARQRVMAEAESGRAEVEAQLRAACPPRDVRDFRMVRIRDAREGIKDQARTGMLNVWDARPLGDALREGKRFLVSNIVPGRAGDWAPPTPGTLREVYLHTRRDTRWQPVE